jgi:HAD superfamily hydrolase (TIGR01509 family)
MDIFLNDTYIFDFDGVVVDSEKYHWMSYGVDISFEEYCRINHSITGPYFRDTMDVAEKDARYREYIKDIPLVAGFEEFYNKISHKNVYIVTNTSQEIFNCFADKFPFLRNIPVISGCKKPDPSGYFSVPIQGRAIAFEDSFRGFHAAKQAISTVVLVNTPEYVYFDMIKPPIHLKNFRDDNLYVC